MLGVTTNAEACVNAIFSRTQLVPSQIQEHEIKILQAELGEDGNWMQVTIWGNQRVAMRRFKSGGRPEADLKEVRNGIPHYVDVWNELLT